MMRDRMERFVVLPFSVGCVSDSSVAVATLCDPHKKPSKSHSNASHPRVSSCEDEEENMKNVFKFLAVSKPEISTGIHRLFKTFSQLFVYKEEDMEDLDVSGMEIGVPTNVRHVSHIGWESTLAWQDLIPPDLLLANAAATKQEEDADHAPSLHLST